MSNASEWQRRVASGAMGEDPLDRDTWVQDELYWAAQMEILGTPPAPTPDVLPRPAEPRYRMLSEYLENPDILKPPPVVIPHLAWENRVTLLSSAEKAGKSTLVGQAAAAVSLGQNFLGQPTKRGAVYWVCLDEPEEGTPS